jgi:hypothetical protein
LKTHQRVYDPFKAKQNNAKHRRKRKMNIPFIAIDGEGTNTKEIVKVIDGQNVYKQIYTLLSSSDGTFIEEWKTGLPTVECLEFLLKYSGDYYLVGFGIGYDVTKILVDLDEASLECLWEIGECLWNGYYLKYIPNKIFVVSKGKERRVTLYDTFGFFQKNFIQSLRDWKIDVPEEIIAGKAARGEFQESDKKQIRKYNYIECRLLVELMNKLRDAAASADFLPNQWYGAGAIAAYMLELNDIKFYADSPRGMIPNFLKAYYGGRNQVLQMGEFKSVVLHDVNSAYPAAMKNLPSSIGDWFQGKPMLYDYPWCLYHVEWNLPEKTIVTPFPVRTKTSISWPQIGSGWYWQPEVWEACKAYPRHIKILDCYYFEPMNADHKPFEFLDKYYEQRKEFIKQDNDAQLVLKLGINACYGKVAQSIGKRDERPPYQNWFWAGYITSQTRAQVFELAMRSPKTIIGFSTDGVASTSQLEENSQEKKLGAWEVKRVQDYFILQSGVYTFTDDEKKTKMKSRGFSARSVDYEALRKIWRKDGILGRYEYKENRFIGIGNGLRQDSALIGCWYQQEREIAFAPTSMDWEENFEKSGKLWTLRLIPPRAMGESEAYQMKVNWIQSQADLDEISDDENV